MDKKPDFVFNEYDRSPSDALTCKYFVQIQKIINAVPKKRIYAITPLG